MASTNDLDQRLIDDYVERVATELAVPKDIQDRLTRGRREMQKDAPKRRLCQRFERGDTYWYIDSKGILNTQSTTTTVSGGGKPPHRIRNSYNFIRPIVENKISQATQRVPSYEVTPSTTDPEDQGAAKLAERVALYGYDRWRVRDATIDTVKLALAGGGEGFALPYFDPNVGPYVPIVTDEGPRVQGYGEIKILVLSRNEVYWEPGCKFHDSRWWAIERARPLDDVREIPGFLGGPLTADASTSDIPTDKPDSDQMVMVTEYFERPCPRYPNGRRLISANKRVIAPPEDYPLKDSEGGVLDEPLLHRLVYTHDPVADKDFGLVWQLIDFERGIQDALCKISEWKNRVLQPQMIAPVGSLIERPNDEPGFVNYYRPIGGLKPEWEQKPAIPDSLFRFVDTMLSLMRATAADEEIQAGPDVAARTIQAVIEQARARWQSFLGDLAEWHSRLMRHCLLLTARHYTEPRLLSINGRTGPYLVKDFQGAQLNGQVDVRVFPGSLEYVSKQQVINRVLAFADRGWVSPQAAMAAINGGTAEKLIQSYELDVARANRIIEKVRDGSVMDMPMRTDNQVDPATGQMVPVETPDWMPREFDNLEVWKSVWADWLKSHEYETLDPGLQEVGKLIWQGLQQLEAQQQQQALMAQQAQAAQQGMDNASRPQRQAPTPMPDQRMPGSDAGANPTGLS